MTLRKGEDTGIGKMALWTAFGGKLAIEQAMYLSQDRLWYKASKSGISVPLHAHS
jgi:hypothetical protein